MEGEEKQPQETEITEERKEEFRKYLEEKKMMDTLTKILVQFYENSDKPEDPIAYVRDYLSKMDGIDINVVNAENKQLTEKLEALNAKLEELNKELEEPPQ